MKKLFRRLFTRTYTLTYMCYNELFTAKYKTYEAAIHTALHLFYDTDQYGRYGVEEARDIAINGKYIDFNKWNEEPFEAYRRTKPKQR